jgi:hypothetical protein
MTLVFLLALAGTVMSDGTQTAATVPAETPAQQPAAGLSEQPEGAFKTAPLSLGRPILRSPFRLFELRELGAGSNRVVADVTQPRSQGDHVVCTMLVVKGNPSIDPGILITIPAGPPDPIVRDDLSRCVQ